MEVITIDALKYMCNHETDYMDSESKNICKKYLAGEQVTNSLLKLYAEKEIETWGDMVKVLIYFSFGEIIIVGKYNNGAEIVSISVAEKAYYCKQNDPYCCSPHCVCNTPRPENLPSK